MLEKIKPQLAVLREKIDDDGDWLYEIKFDGYRILAEVENGQVRLYSRNGLDWTRKFPYVCSALAQLPVSHALFDGEAVVFKDDGTTDFQALQNSILAGRSGSVSYCVFDLIFCNGEDLHELPLLTRKERLQKVLGDSPAESQKKLFFSEHIRGSWAEILKFFCSRGLEGIIAKRATSVYENRRSDAWVKLKCWLRQEFVIAGFTEPGGSRTGFGALLLGYYTEGKLIYCGRVGTGFSEQSIAELVKKLKPLVTKIPAFDVMPNRSEQRSVHWVRPELVGEVAFAGWSRDGRLRHPSFQGVRLDKAARQVGREDASADFEKNQRSKKQAKN